MASGMRSGRQVRRLVQPRARLRAEQVVEGRSVLVRVTGELDSITADTLSATLTDAEAVVSPPAPVVVDLTGVTFLGAAGLSVLVEHHERCAAIGSALLIVPGSKAVRRAMTVTGLHARLALIPAPR
ncbi:STAS domain-containing protein [Actinophytocola sp. KF-1]